MEKYTVKIQGEGDADSLVGQVLADRYLIEGLIGRGGMGTVYKGLQLGLKRPVAIKVLRAELSRLRTPIERFRREAELTASLSHPNIVTVHDFAMLPNSRAYLVMEFLPGPTLADRLVVKPYPTPVQVAEYFKSVCAAISALHKAGVIHRDIKPTNIILPSEGEPESKVKVVDFGLVRLVETQSSQDLTGGNVLGTPTYMAPELLTGEQATPSTDIYALGVTAYVAFTGCLPFEGATVQEIIYKQAYRQPRRPCEIRPDLPLKLDLALLKAIERDPVRRFESVDAFSRALDSAFDGTAIPEPAWSGFVPDDIGERSFDETPTSLGSILVVEDDGVVRQLVAMLLKRHGYDITEAVDGVEALLHLGNRRFDMILSDFRIPYLDGLTLLRALSEKGNRTPVVFLSATTDKSIERSCLDLGARAFLSKPPAIDVLLSTVRDVLLIDGEGDPR